MARFQEAKFWFAEAKFWFAEAKLTDDESIVHITAYVLQVNGAKAGTKRLTRTTGTSVSSAASNLQNPVTSPKLP